MLDKNGNKLLKSSPLKMGFNEFMFGENNHRKQGAIAFDTQKGEVIKSQKRLSDFQNSNPYLAAQNAFKGLDNEFADAENVYDKAKNVYEGKMKNPFEGQENAFEGMKNQYEDMENAFEDLTVNTQQAEFEAQQNQQQQANILSQMQGAAGGSGIAALAQSMANQGALQSQKAAASIGSQEAANAKLAAQGEQQISMASAGEASKQAMQQASEQARLDTQSNSAEMDIQNKILGADEALQAQQLGEASKLQMAQMQEASNLQMAKAQGAMDVQAMKLSGEEGMMERDLDIRKTQLQASMEKLSIYNSAAQTAKDQGHFGEILGFVGNIIGGLMSDVRLKENINHIGYSEAGIPTYEFNYKNNEKTWFGTMAQDLIELGRADAVSMYGNYYMVDYSLIDVDMKEVKPSPFKQLNPQMDEQTQHTQHEMLGSMEAGMDILAAGKRRKNWEETQLTIRSVEPLPKQLRRLKDQILLDNQKEYLSSRGLNQEEVGIDSIANNEVFMGAIRHQLNNLQNELYQSLQIGDKYIEKDVKMKIAGIKRMTEVFNERMLDFYEDHFGMENKLSKGVSEQQLSFGTQIFCKNNNLQIIIAEKYDIIRGERDYYGNILKEDNFYAIVESFQGEFVLINILEANKGCWVRRLGKINEYLTFIQVIADEAEQTRKGKMPGKMPFGKVEAKLDAMFGHNDGTSTKQQDQLVLEFAHDDILGDASTFRRHLYEHPNIQNLNYGGFDWDNLELQRDLGPGDKDFWYDEIDMGDRLRLVDAIVNTDSPFFNPSLLRTLVKEYYIGLVEESWWKAMGYEEGKLDIMRLKRKEVLAQRFAMEKAKAAKDGQENFTFDGKVYSTGVDPNKYKELKKVQLQQAKANMPSMQEDAKPKAGQ
tara:strand:+ start:721 stop:3357 length:2637 start_codon:yes stop_codon:yes gene_type:complete